MLHECIASYARPVDEHSAAYLRLLWRKLSHEVSFVYWRSDENNAHMRGSAESTFAEKRILTLQNLYIYNGYII